MIEPSELSNMNVTDLFFDYNSAIHPCAQQILSINHEKYINIENLYERNNIIETDIIENCLLYTSHIINQVKPLNVYITIDGVAPRSKMNQQRERRYKSEFFKITGSEKSSLWDSNKITPGTCFMNKLKNKLGEFKNSLTNCKVIISDSSENGEGEHKIMTIINGNLESSQAKRICIYGLDADLIMLSLMNKNCNEIVLIRDNSFNNKLSDDKKTIDYVDIKNLRKYICRDIIDTLKLYTQGDQNFDEPNSSDSLIYDYVVLCFFLGNDFLDRLPSLSIQKNGIDTVMKAYAYSWKGNHLINKKVLNDKILWKSALNITFLKDIMFQLKNHESYFFKNFKLESLATSEHKMLSELQEQENIEFYKDDIIFSDESPSSYKNRYNTFYGLCKVDEACLNYIEGIYWIFGYYSNHIHKNWTWYYQYHNPPFCSDIFEYLRKNQNQIQYYINSSHNLNTNQSYSCLKQLYMVLPKVSLKNILSELNQSEPSQEINTFLFKFKEYYPDKLFVDLINKRYLWQTKILFNNIDDSVIDLFLH